MDKLTSEELLSGVSSCARGPVTEEQLKEHKATIAKAISEVIGAYDDAQGTKHDMGKPPLSWIPRSVLEQEAQVLAFGATKYGRNNYKKGMEWSRVLDAALRHIYAFVDGENTDNETSLSHLAHAKCNLTMLMYFVEHNKGIDDRSESYEEVGKK